MKKLIAILLSLSLVFSFPVLALADGTTTLTTTVPQAEYTLNIPADVTVNYGATSVIVKELTATATAGFNVGKNLAVTVEYTPFTAEEVSTTIPFSSAEATPYASGGAGTSLALNSGDTLTFTCIGTNNIVPTDGNGKTTLSGNSYKNYVFWFYLNSADWGKALAGDYTATITFTSEIVAAEE